MNTYNKIMNWLEDEESRFVFSKRHEYFQTKDFSNIREIIEKYVPEFIGSTFYHGKEDELVHWIKQYDKTMLWGGRSSL